MKKYLLNLTLLCGLVAQEEISLSVPTAVKENPEVAKEVFMDIQKLVDKGISPAEAAKEAVQKAVEKDPTAATAAAAIAATAVAEAGGSEKDIKQATKAATAVAVKADPEAKQEIIEAAQEGKEAAAAAVDPNQQLQTEGRQEISEEEYADWFTIQAFALTTQETKFIIDHLSDHNLKDKEVEEVKEILAKIKKLYKIEKINLLSDENQKFQEMSHFSRKDIKTIIKALSNSDQKDAGLAKKIIKRFKKLDNIELQVRRVEYAWDMPSSDHAKAPHDDEAKVNQKTEE